MTDQSNRNGQLLLALITRIYPATRYISGVVVVKTPVGEYDLHLNPEIVNMALFDHLPVSDQEAPLSFNNLAGGVEDLLTKVASGELEIISAAWIKKKTNSMLREDPAVSGIVALRDLSAAAQELVK